MARAGAGFSARVPLAVCGVRDQWVLHRRDHHLSLPAGQPTRPGQAPGAVLAAVREEPATYWEAWCLLLTALLALERFLNGATPAPSARQAWAGLAVLAAGLSLDELGSLHERADFLFAPWGFSGRSALLPPALPATVLLDWTLQRLVRFPKRRAFWLTVGAFVALGSVAAQEHLKHALRWPWWLRGLRFGVMEGCSDRGPASPPADASKNHGRALST
jgi:hypothetical protein